MTNRGNTPAADHLSNARPAMAEVIARKGGFRRAALRIFLWSVLALGLTAAVHFANIVTLQGFQLGFYFAAQGIPVALVAMAFWWTRRAGADRAGLLPPGSLVTGAFESAAILLSPAIVILVAGELLQAGYDGLSTTLGIAAGLVLAILLFSETGWTRAPHDTQSGATTSDTADAVSSDFPVGLFGVLLAVCLIPLIAAHLILALDLTGPLLGEDAQGRLWLLAGLSLGVAIIASLPVAGLASTFLVAAFIALTVGTLTLAGALALQMPDNPLPIPQISYGLALDQIKTLERALILDGLADPAGMHQHSRPFTSWSEVNFSAFLLCAIFAAAALAGYMMLSANRTAAAIAASQGHAPSKLPQGGQPEDPPSQSPMPAPRAALTARALSWAGFLVLLVTITLPAISAFTKLEIYRSVAGGIALEDQPVWLRNSQFSGAVGVCQGSADAPTQELADTDGPDSGPGPGPGPEPDADPFDRPETSEPQEGETGAATLAAGEVAEAVNAAVADAQFCAGPAPRLAIDDIAIEANRSGLVSAALAGVGPGGLQTLAAAIAAAILAGAVGLSRLAAGGIAGLGQPPRRSAMTGALAALVIMAAAAMLALTWAHPTIDLAKVALSLLAAILFPALSVAALRPSASTPAILIAALTGAVLTGYYIVATTYTPEVFAMQWRALSSAPDWKYEELIRLMDACQDGDQPSCASAGHFAGELANWWGLKTSASGILGLPVGLLAGLLAASILPARKAS